MTYHEPRRTDNGSAPPRKPPLLYPTMPRHHQAVVRSLGGALTLATADGWAAMAQVARIRLVPAEAAALAWAGLMAAQPHDVAAIVEALELPSGVGAVSPQTEFFREWRARR